MYVVGRQGLEPRTKGLLAEIKRSGIQDEEKAARKLPFLMSSKRYK